MKVKMHPIRVRPVAALLSVVAAWTMGASSFAQSPEETLVDVVLKDADLLTATRMLTQRTGLQFVVEPSQEPFGTITLDLRRQPADLVIRYICQAAGAFFRKDENGVYIISRTKKVEAEAKADPSNAKAVSVFRKIKLQKADARSVYMSVLDINPYDPAFVFSEMNRFNNIANPGPTRKTVNQMLSDFSPEGYSPLPNTKAFQTPRSGSESGNDILLPGEVGQQIGAGEGGGGRGGFGGFGGGGQGGGIGGGGQGGLGGGFGGQGGGFLPPGLDLFSYDPTDNSLVVQGTEEAINALQRIIAEFDRAPKQVEIKVEFVTTQSTLATALGYDIRYQRGTTLFNSAFAPQNTPFFFSYATGNAAFRVGQILIETGGKGIQAPTIRTMNNQPASISSTTQLTLFVSRVITNPNGNIVVTDAIPVNVQTGLSVQPRINNDGTITMFLAPQVSEVGQIRTDPQGNEFPDIVSQTISVTARVKNGETIALGGFNKKDTRTGGQRYPILSDIPIIGQFFRSRNSTRNDTELMIFVTPTIVEEDETIGAANP